MKERFVLLVAHLVVAASSGFAALGVADVWDSSYAESWGLFSVVFVVMLCLSVASGK